MNVGRSIQLPPGWPKRARDAAELGSIMGRNSPVPNVIHAVAGIGGALGIVFGTAHLFPSEKDAKPGQLNREEWMRRAGIGMMAAGWMTTIITAGMRVGSDISARNAFRAAETMLGEKGIKTAGFTMQQVEDAVIASGDRIGAGILSEVKQTPRGINPMYFLGVGAGATASFIVPKIRDAYEN